MNAINKDWQQLVKRFTLRSEEAAREKGIKEGMAIGETKGETKGIYNTQREVTMSIFKMKYPNVDITLIDHLTLEQYKAIFNLLLQDAAFEEIETIIHMK